MISDEQMVKFKKIMREEVGEEKFSQMSEQYLLESAIKLMSLMRLIYKPMTQEEFDWIEERRKATAEEHQE